MANIKILCLSIFFHYTQFIDAIGTHTILTKITNIHWLNIKSLYLDRNRITNIQTLTLIQDLQNLKTLSLSNNYITNIKCLRRLYCKKLNLIVLGMSYFFILIIDSNHVTQVFYQLFDLPHLQCLSLGMFYDL